MTVRRSVVVGTNRQETLSFTDTLENIRAADASASGITTTGLADIAGLSFDLSSGCTYRFEWELQVVTSLLATVGFAVAYSGTSGAVFYNATIGGSVSGVGSLLTVVSGALGLGATTPVRVCGRIRGTTSVGTLSLQGQKSAGTVTLVGCGQLTRV